MFLQYFYRRLSIERSKSMLIVALGSRRVGMLQVLQLGSSERACCPSQRDGRSDFRFVFRVGSVSCSDLHYVLIAVVFSSSTFLSVNGCNDSGKVSPSAI